MPVRGQTKPLGEGYVVNFSVHAPKRKIRSAQTFICGDHADEIQMWCCRSTPGVWHVVEVSRYWQQGGACYQAGDGSLDDFVNEHPVQEAPYRVHAAIRAAVGPAAEDSTNKKEHANSFLLSKSPRFRHKSPWTPLKLTKSTSSLKVARRRLVLRRNSQRSGQWLKLTLARAHWAYTLNQTTSQTTLKTN